MKGNREVIELLNEVLAGELVAINQYFLHAKMCRNWGYLRIAEHIRHESIDEMKHADALVERVKSRQGRSEIQLAEIFLPVDNPAQEGQVADLANRLVAQIRERQAPFQAVARQFSKGTGAGSGGEFADAVASNRTDQVERVGGVREERQCGDEPCTDKEWLSDGRVTDGVGVSLRAVVRQINACDGAEPAKTIGESGVFKPRLKEAWCLGALARSNNDQHPLSLPVLRCSARLRHARIPTR